MATIHSSEPTLQTLHHHFSPTQEMRLREEDLVAGRTVSSILIAVVGAAMLAGVSVVAWITLFAR